MSTLTEEERAKGVITASAGNHAQGVAYAAKCYGAKATIVMPTITPLIKVNRTKGYGAEVVLYGDVYDEACEYALKLAEEKGLTFVHPFDDLDVATGQGSIAMEIIKELPTVDYILVPVGGGDAQRAYELAEEHGYTFVHPFDDLTVATGQGTIAMEIVKELPLWIISSFPSVAAAGNRRFHAGEAVKSEDQGDRRRACKCKLHAGIHQNGKVTTLPSVNTIADGTAVKTPGTKIFRISRKNLDDIITVEDAELVGAFLDMVENHKLIVENSVC